MKREAFAQKLRKEKKSEIMVVRRERLTGSKEKAEPSQEALGAQMEQLSLNADFVDKNDKEPAEAERASSDVKPEKALGRLTEEQIETLIATAKIEEEVTAPFIKFNDFPADVMKHVKQLGWKYELVEKKGGKYYLHCAVDGKEYRQLGSTLRKYTRVDGFYIRR